MGKLSNVMVVILLFFFFFLQNGASASLELDLEQYLVPSPTCANSGVVYAANLTESPRTFGRTGVFSKTDASSSGSHGTTNSSVGPVDHTSSKKVFAWQPFPLSKRTKGSLYGLIICC